MPAARDPNRYDQEFLGRAETVRRVGLGKGETMFPRVSIRTSMGELIVKLDREAAPATVDNFLQYVRTGYYDGTIFHQVEPGFIAAAGGYMADMQPKPTGSPIRNEAHNGRKNMRGTLAMVRFDKIDSATSQFMINLADNPQLDHQSRTVPAPGEPDEYGYCVFGEIVGGWETLDKLEKAPVGSSGQFRSAPVTPITIERIDMLD
jgi:cyclophilin family peptidyl-prolyl cis-trans isomerase